jgi:hypothetical protein
MNYVEIAVKVKEQANRYDEAACRFVIQDCNEAIAANPENPKIIEYHLLVKACYERISDIQIAELKEKYPRQWAKA